MSLHEAEAYTGINLATASRSFPIELEKLNTLNRDHDSVLLQEIGGVR
jgi:P-type Ca2+ transporter type 2C